MVRIVLLVVSLLVVCVFDPALGYRHRRHHHQHHRSGSRRTDDRTSTMATLTSDEVKLNATETLKNMLQTSPKDALVVTKRRFLRRDWCQSQPLIQRIGQDQCLSTTVLNRFCYGQCNSFFIPKNELKEEGDSAHQRWPEGRPEGSSDAVGAVLAEAGIRGTARAFRSCAVCQPKKTSWVTVTLKCPSLVPNIRRRRVLIINQCRCMQPESTSSSS